MPITAFNSFTDGLDPNQRSREHFIANINVDDERRWVDRKSTRLNSSHIQKSRMPSSA